MKALIFGVNGQDGILLSRLLQSENIEVLGVSRSGNGIKGDVSDIELVKGLVALHQPDYIFHFAANSTTQHSALFENHAAISTGSLNILESVRQYSPATKVFLSGSAMQFVNDGTPINEQTGFYAGSPYSIARIHTTYAARYYRDVFGLKVYVGFFFNHDSPLRSERHVNQKIVEAVKRIKKGSKDKLTVGDIDTKKEFNFAGDIVKAVWVLVQQDEVFEAVIGTGIAYSIRDWLIYCFGLINVAWEDFVIVDPSYKTEYKILVSDPKKIYSLGWKPEVSFSALADMMLRTQMGSVDQPAD